MYEKRSERGGGQLISYILLLSQGHSQRWIPLALDQLIDDFADLIKDQYDIKELADPSSGTDVGATHHTALFNCAINISH
jgi:hypothetical protein